MIVSILPYVYVLTHRETGQFYIGVRVANKVRAKEDLGQKYFTSSKKIKPIFDQFEARIVAEFLTRESAFDFEQCMIKSHWGNPLMLNENYFSVTEKTVRVFDFSKSEEHRKKIAAKQMGNQNGAGSKNRHYGRGYEKTGAKNPKARVWTIVNNRTGETYKTDDLVSLAKQLGVSYSSLASSTTYNPNRTWFSTREKKQ